MTRENSTTVGRVLSIFDLHVYFIVVRQMVRDRISSSAEPLEQAQWAAPEMSIGRTVYYMHSFHALAIYTYDEGRRKRRAAAGGQIHNVVWPERDMRGRANGQTPGGLYVGMPRLFCIPIGSFCQTLFPRSTYWAP